MLLVVEGSWWRGRRESDSQCSASATWCKFAAIWTDTSFFKPASEPQPPQPPQVVYTQGRPPRARRLMDTSRQQQQQQPTTNNQQPTQAGFPQECPLFCVTSANSFMLAAAPAANETLAARRRKRRLRQFLRHERLTVAMLLAERPPHRSTGTEAGQER